VAYKNLVGLQTANRAEVFKRFRDFVCKRNGSYDYSVDGIGWTLHDAVYAVDQDTINTNDYFVIYSPGESGDEDLYFKCTYVANYIQIIGFLYWNNTTHAGVQQYNSSPNNFSIADTDVPVLWIYGDLDAIFAISRKTATDDIFNPVVFGMTTNTLYSQEVFTCAGALSSGADRVIDIGTVPADWQVGHNVFIRDTANIARITITARTASTITATLATNYLAGAKLSADLGYFCISGNSFNYQNKFLIDHYGNKNSSGDRWNYNSTVLGYGYPDKMRSEAIVTPLYTGIINNGYLGELKNTYARGSTAMVDLNVYQFPSGLTVRAFTTPGSFYLCVKEVA